MKKRHLSEVRINYGYNSDEWENIRIQYDDGYSVSVTREQIDAFKRMHKVVRDLQEVEKLRDELVSIFGSKVKIPTELPSTPE